MGIRSARKAVFLGLAFLFGGVLNAWLFADRVMGENGYDLIALTMLNGAVIGIVEGFIGILSATRSAMCSK